MPLVLGPGEHSRRHKCPGVVVNLLEDDSTFTPENDNLAKNTGTSCDRFDVKLGEIMSEEARHPSGSAVMLDNGQSHAARAEAGFL